MIKPKITNQAYQLYRNKLLTSGVQSFIDQNGKTFASCNECQKDCKNGNGCMQGELTQNILDKIRR